jgi:apolipoprotein N-acyltransferase
VIGFGFWRLATTPNNSPLVRVGLIASDAAKNVNVAEPQPALQLFAEYARQADILAAQGAQVIVIPEKTGVVIESTAAAVDRTFGEVAARDHVTILAGVLRPDGSSRWNEARLYSPDGNLEALYEKHHMLPGFESNLTVGTSRVHVSRPSGTWGVAICKDMDFPKLSRQYGVDGAGLMLVPAWDFVLDGWLHGRMAILRGVEDGFSMARAPKQGILTVTDDRGRVLAERVTSSAPFATVIATVPVRHDATFYARFGDWFAWLDIALLIVLLGMPLIARH